MANNIFTVLSDEDTFEHWFRPMIRQSPRLSVKGFKKSLHFQDSEIWIDKNIDNLIKAQKLHTLQQVVEWGDKPCHRHGELVLQRECDKCWQEALVAKVKG